MIGLGAMDRSAAGAGLKSRTMHPLSSRAESASGLLERWRPLNVLRVRHVGWQIEILLRNAAAFAAARSIESALGAVRSVVTDARGWLPTRGGASSPRPPATKSARVAVGRSRRNARMRTRAVPHVASASIAKQRPTAARSRLGVTPEDLLNVDQLSSDAPIKKNSIRPARRRMSAPAPANGPAARRQVKGEE